MNIFPGILNPLRVVLDSNTYLRPPAREAEFICLPYKLHGVYLEGLLELYVETLEIRLVTKTPHFGNQASTIAVDSGRRRVVFHEAGGFQETYNCREPWRCVNAFIICI